MGFETNHKNRDVSLPKQRAKLLNAIEEDVINDKNVLAVYYGGSIANQSTDVYSDIDLRIVVRDEVFEEYVSNKK